MPIHYYIFVPTSNHKLPVEAGRYSETEYADRKCHLCMKEIGDEYHYLFTCPVFKELRRKLLPKKCFTNPSMYKYKDLMNTENLKTLTKVCVFISNINKNIAGNAQ